MVDISYCIVVITAYSAKMRFVLPRSELENSQGCQLKARSVRLTQMTFLPLEKWLLIYIVLYGKAMEH